MCDVITPTVLAYAAIASSMATAGASMYAQRESAKAQTRATNQQNKLQAEEISDASGQKISEVAREARRNRATARVLAGESGVNLGSGSFLAQMQASASNQYNDSGLILQNEKSQQAARHASATSALSSVWKPSLGEAALTIGAAGVNSYTNIKGAK